MSNAGLNLKLLSLKALEPAVGSSSQASITDCDVGLPISALCCSVRIYKTGNVKRAISELKACDWAMMYYNAWYIVSTQYIFAV